MTAPMKLLEAWDAMADSIANRRDDCLSRGHYTQAELYRDMIAGHREARAAVAELVEVAKRAYAVLDNLVSTDESEEHEIQACDDLWTVLEKFGGAA